MRQQIVIVGLGPGDQRYLTAEAIAVLEQAEEVYVRTRQHPTVPALPGKAAVHSFDALYDTAGSFDALYRAIAEQVLALGARPQGVVYAVPGHPLVGETTVRLILQGALERNLHVHIVDGLSFVGPIVTALRIDALEGLQLADALDLAAQHSPRLDPDRPALVAQLYSRQVASDVKLTLLSIYPPGHLVTRVRNAGVVGQTVRPLPLQDLDREDADHLTSLYIPPLPQAGSLLTFQDLVAQLRSPLGCPWDREQTHQSLRSHLLEETYEVLAALDLENMDELKEELGDLLLQIVLHTQIASECGEFTMPDVVGHITQKLRRRHPHVFGQTEVEGTRDILRNWEEIKRAEKGAQRVSSTFDGVPGALPALARAQAVGERAARIGLDWPHLEAIWLQASRQWATLQEASEPQVRARALGDLLFTLAGAGRRLAVDAESALRQATARFVARVIAAEEQDMASGQPPRDVSPPEMETFWAQIQAGPEGD